MPPKSNRREVKVNVRRLAGRPIQLKFWCPVRREWLRRSTGTYDLREARKQAKQLEAELIAGTYDGHTERRWQEFRDAYEDNELSQLRPSSREHAISALSLCDKILKPRFLSEVADASALVEFRNQLLAGKESRFERPRSGVTVKSYLTDIMVALRWAKRQGWIREVPELPRVRAAVKQKSMKGRPISAEEFERMLAKAPNVVGADVAPSWVYLLRGLWASALRIDEAMHVSWDIPNTIQPSWSRGRRPLLLLPAHLQKNNEASEIPLLPWFEALLLETPEPLRTGWVFGPETLNARLGRRARVERPSGEWVGKIISRIGEAAGVIVEPQRGKMPTKYASAHDLRRSCANRLEAAGVPPLVIALVMRHQSFETTMKHYRRADVQRYADDLNRLLSSKQVTTQVTDAMEVDGLNDASF